MHQNIKNPLMHHSSRIYQRTIFYRTTAASFILGILFPFYASKHKMTHPRTTALELVERLSFNVSNTVASSTVGRSATVCAHAHIIPGNTKWSIHAHLLTFLKDNPLP